MKPAAPTSGNSTLCIGGRIPMNPVVNLPIQA